MSIPQVTLQLQINSLYLQQVLAGFRMLQRQGLVRVALDFAGNFRQSTRGRNFLLARYSGRLLAYDLSDSSELPASYGGSQPDLIFKRMVRDAHTCPSGTPVFPLGFSQQVYAGNFRWRKAWQLVLRRRVKMALQLVARESQLLSRVLRIQDCAGQCHHSRFDLPPSMEDPPCVVFRDQIWRDDPALSDESRSRRAAMNDLRIGCYRALRDAYGSRLIGGLRRTADSERVAPDCELLDGRAYSRKAFRRAIRSASIGVVTLGLEDSIGKKHTEYVAAGRGVVTERFDAKLPGDCAEGSHYLSYSTPDECVAQVQALMDNPERLQAMMLANRAYYRQYIRPDQLVLNSLATATRFVAETR